MSDQTPPAAMTSAQAEAWRQRLRYRDDGLDQGYARPADVEPLASRIERAVRVSDCRLMTEQMLAEWADEGAPVAYYDGVWTKEVRIDFLVLTWKGAFCVWSIDHRWTVFQAALVERARAQIQAELAGWPGQVEAVFHSPREPTGWNRHLMLHPDTDEPVEVVTMGGSIAQLLHDWQPAGGVGLDPEWIVWLDEASAPRWWRSNEGRLRTGAIPPEERG